jgi:riboflavin synthase
MFTGLIEEVGKLQGRRALPGGVRLKIQAHLSGQLNLGASVNVHGACQTVVAFDQETFEVEAVGATLEKTTLGELRLGALVNLERALRADQRLDGHLVSGHVQATGRVKSFSSRGAAWALEIEVPQELHPFVLPEGSIALDGISLTIAAVTPQGVLLSVIPHTRENTSLSQLRVGQLVNIETDSSVRALRAPETKGLSWENLKAWGYS